MFIKCKNNRDLAERTSLIDRVYSGNELLDNRTIKNEVR